MLYTYFQVLPNYWDFLSKVIDFIEICIACYLSYINQLLSLFKKMEYMSFLLSFRFKSSLFTLHSTG